MLTDQVVGDVMGHPACRQCVFLTLAPVICMQCASLPAVRAFIDNLDPQMNRNLHMVLGPGCSSGATVVAPLANAWNLTTVSTGIWCAVVSVGEVGVCGGGGSVWGAECG